MNQFVALTDVLAWPFVVLILAYMMRKPIKALLPLVDKIKYKDFEIAFSQRVIEAKKEFEESGIELPTVEKEESEIYTLAKTSPSSVVQKAWNEIEFASRKKVESLLPLEINFSDPLRRPIAFLEFSGSLIPPVVRTMHELELLRNKVVHSTDASIKQSDALEYYSLAKGVLAQIEAVTQVPNIKLTALTLIVNEINHIIDTGKYVDISIEDAHEAIKNKRIIPYLVEITGSDADFSLLGSDGAYQSYIKHYDEKMYRIYNAYAGDESRKWGVENSGLCLLLAWTNEIIQLGSGWHPSD